MLLNHKDLTAQDAEVVTTALGHFMLTSGNALRRFWTSMVENLICQRRCPTFGLVHGE